MKYPKVLSVVIAIVMLMAFVIPANAQLGEQDGSSFTVQNVSAGDAQVTIIFVDQAGTQITPPVLNASKTNPFTLHLNESFEIVVPQVPSLPDGSYSVIISSTAEVVAIANLQGKGSLSFNGSYQGFKTGTEATKFYLPGVVFNYYKWYSLISVQNVSANPANITVTIKCSNITATGTLTANNVPGYASHTFVLKDPAQIPTGFTSGTSCNGAAEIISTQPVVATDNQSDPTTGKTQSYSGMSGGFQKLYVPALYYNYYGWGASLNILKLTSGNTTVTVTYSNGGTNTCNLTDLSPSCLLIMKVDHPVQGYFGASITSTPASSLVAIANAALGSYGGVSNQAQTYNAVGSGSQKVGIPAAYKSYYGWFSSFTCQNVGTIDTQIRIKYEGYSANDYTHPTVLSAATNGTVEVVQKNEAFLPLGYHGAVEVEALAAGAAISCIQNYKNNQNSNPVNPTYNPGDWSTSNNSFPK